jgi:hypothetical protein
MGQRVAFATSNSKDRTRPSNGYYKEADKQKEWDIDSSSKFNGFPFPIVYKKITPELTGPFTLEEATYLFWVCANFHLSISFDVNASASASSQTSASATVSLSYDGESNNDPFNPGILNLITRNDETILLNVGQQPTLEMKGEGYKTEANDNWVGLGEGFAGYKPNGELAHYDEEYASALINVSAMNPLESRLFKSPGARSTSGGNLLSVYKDAEDDPDVNKYYFDLLGFNMPSSAAPGNEQDQFYENSISPRQAYIRNFFRVESFASYVSGYNEFIPTCLWDWGETYEYCCCAGFSGCCGEDQQLDSRAGFFPNEIDEVAHGVQYYICSPKFTLGEWENWFSNNFVYSSFGIGGSNYYESEVYEQEIPIEINGKVSGKTLKVFIAKVTAIWDQYNYGETSYVNVSATANLLKIKCHNFFEYANSKGEPVYDKTTGAELKDPLS